MASQEDLCHIMQSTNTYYKQTVFKNKVPEEQQNGYDYLHCLWESARGLPAAGQEASRGF